MLTPATTDDSARALAKDLLVWKAETAPGAQPPTVAARAYRVSQISRESLPYLSPEQVSAVYRQGRLDSIGAPAPPPKNSRHH